MKIITSMIMIISVLVLGPGGSYITSMIHNFPVNTSAERERFMYSIVKCWVGKRWV